MITDGMDFSTMYNSMTCPPTGQYQQQAPPFYGQNYPNSFTQSTISTYGAYSMYSSPSTTHLSQYNSHDHITQSTAETLAAFTHPNELSMINHSQAHLNATKSQRTSMRRLVKDFPNTHNTTRMHYCETCRIECGGYATYQAHLKGSKHKKKELGTQNQQTSVNILRCELCDITCTSSDAYKAHLEGSKHEKAMKLHRKLGKTIPSIEPKILNSSSLTSQSINVSQSSTNGSQISTNQEQTITLSRLLENSNKPIGEEYIVTTFDANNKPVLYHCKLCECTFNDIKGKDVHLKGKRHRISYKKKVNPNFIVDNKLSTPKQKQINSKTTHTQQPIDSFNQSELDDDTKYLMMLHKQIVPSPQLIETIEQFVGVVESALKLCSEQLQTSSTTSTNQSPLMGVSRTGQFGKSLLIKTDRLFQLVVICTKWPTKNLLQSIATMLSDNLDEKWKNDIQMDYQNNMETIELQTITTEGIFYLSIAFTSLVIQQERCEDTSEEFLSKINCLNVLYSLNSTRWFQNQVGIRQHASALIRCLRYKSSISTKWQSLPSEAFEILIDSIPSQSLTAIHAFRRVLQYLSGGLILSNGCDLHEPWQIDSNKNIFEDLTDQQRNDITQEAQIGLRLMSFGQLMKWFEESTVSLTKRPYSEYDDFQISTKRQCMNSIEEKNILF